MVKEITEREFSNVIKSNKKVLVDCYAPWCSPCKMISPIVDMLSEEIKDVSFYKINVDNAQEMAVNYGIMSIPTLLIFENGEMKNRVVGFRSKGELEDLLK